MLYAVCLATISTVRMQQHKLRTYYFIDHTPHCRSTAAAQTHHCNCDVLAVLKCRMYHQTMSMNRHLSLRSRLSGLLSRPLEICGASCYSFENASMATLACACVQTALQNCGPFELVAERIFYALQVRTRTL